MQPAPKLEKVIRITNKEVISFYEENKHLDVVSMNLLFIEIMKSLSVNLTHNITSTVNSKILDIVTEMSANMNSLKMEFVMKMHESKKEYLEDVKSILSTSSLSSLDRINSVVEKSIENLVAKTTLLLNDIVPKSQERNKVELEAYIRSQCAAITNDTQKLLAITSKDDRSANSIGDILEAQLNKMITNIQQPIFSVINSSEDRNSSKLRSLEETLNFQKKEQAELSGNLNDFLSRYKANSQVKGNVGETQMLYMLQHLLPSDEITRVNGNTANCDIRVRRYGNEKPTILFECKDYSDQVQTREVEKFERDVREQKTHGIMVSHKSPITFKRPYEINIINNLIHVYVPNCEYSTEKLNIAIDIVDSLDLRLKSLERDRAEGNASLSRSDYYELVREYNDFAEKKAAAIDSLNKMTTQLKNMINLIELPKLKSWFISNGSLENDSDLLCKYCKCYEGKNKTSLGAHVRRCKSNPSRSVLPDGGDSDDICVAIDDREVDCCDVNAPASGGDLVVELDSGVTINAKKKVAKKVKNVGMS